MTQGRPKLELVFLTRDERLPPPHLVAHGAEAIGQQSGTRPAPSSGYFACSRNHHEPCSRRLAYRGEGAAYSKSPLKVFAMFLLVY
jgi:hypothetical protein